MTVQLTLDAAFHERDLALAAVEEHADTAWKERALEAVRLTCERHAFWHVDLVWETGLDQPRDARALGAVIRNAARRGWCTRTSTTAPSVRSNGAHKPRWASNLYRGAAA